MAGSVNKVVLIGHLGRDPEIRFDNAGDKIASFSIVTSESWKDRQTGEKKERTEWHRVVCFNDHISDVIEKYLTKGSKVYLEGKLQTRKWTDQQGVDKYTTEVVLPKFRGELVMLDNKGNGGPPPAEGQDDYGQTKTYDQGPVENQNGNPGGDLDDQIPF